ncbi:voltage-gated potassium channel KCNC1-like isoform X2 [Convolutriloba macropyga]|uniref:voltage-gated potassium channel KCNC1-like isoform X2 n=1 Tax=Convolutriloba macropyga TaxID=536237 RepID=UPI003F5250F4
MISMLSAINSSVKFRKEGNLVGGILMPNFSFLTLRDTLIEQGNPQKLYRQWSRRSQSRGSTKQPLSAVPSGDDPQASSRQTEKVTLNVGGTVFITFKDTLTRVPCTRLYYLMKTPIENLHPAEFDSQTGAYFFDRHPGLFEHILNYYRTGQLHVPRDICWPLFENELSYWGLDHTHLESCCWMVYRHHTDNENTLKALDEEDKNEKLDWRVGDTNLGPWDRNMCKLWELIDDPMSSITSKCIAFLSLTLILVSVAIFCLETHKLFREETGVKVFNITLSNGQQATRTEITTRPLQFLFYIETVCIVWFCLEFLIRLISCPSKLMFIKSPLNIVDFLAILPYFVDLYKTTSNSTGFLRIVRICRVFRVFKLTRHLTGLKILWHTLHASMKELFILAIFMCLGVVIFASLIFYAERLFEDSNPDTDFIDIPHGFWWALVTMTTLGYGDMVPKTFSGQIVGSLCALCGLLTIALPVPVIVSNFSLYYSHYQAKVKLPKNHFKDKEETGSRNNSSSFNSGSQTLPDSPIHQRCSGILESPDERSNVNPAALYVQMPMPKAGSFSQAPPSDFVPGHVKTADYVPDGIILPNMHTSNSQQHISSNDFRHMEHYKSKGRKQSAPVETRLGSGSPDTPYNIYYDPPRVHSSLGSHLSPVLGLDDDTRRIRDDMGTQLMPRNPSALILDQNHHSSSSNAINVPSSSSSHEQTTSSASSSQLPQQPQQNSKQNSSKSKQSSSSDRNSASLQYVQVECEV